MKKHIVCVVICVAFLFGAWCETVSCQTKQIETGPPQGKLDKNMMKTEKELIRGALKDYRPDVFPDSYKWDGTGDLQREALDQKTGELWLIAVNRTSHDSPPFVGFISSSLLNPGTTDWKGVKISATFEVYKCEGVIGLVAYPPQAAYRITRISAPGTYTIISEPFDMKPNVKYDVHAGAQGMSDTPLNVVSFFYGKVTSIKFIFP